MENVARTSSRNDGDGSFNPFMLNRYRFRCKPVSRANFHCCDNINCMLFLYESVVSNLIEREKGKDHLQPHSVVRTCSLFTRPEIQTRLYKLFFLCVILLCAGKTIDLYQGARDRKNENSKFIAYKCRCEGVNYLRRFLSTWTSLMPFDRSEHCPLRTSTGGICAPYGVPGTMQCKGVSRSRPTRLRFNVMTFNWSRLGRRAEWSASREARRCTWLLRSVVVDVRSSLQDCGSKTTFYDPSYNVN